MPYLYTFLIKAYGVAIVAASLFSEKARVWIAGRKGLFDNLKTAIANKQQWIWFHAASLGEFEQGRPLIEYIRSRHPEYGILLSFFSPSGYLVRKNYTGADHVTYIPLDTSGNAKRFVDIVKPVMAIFIKYEIWYHHLSALEQARVSTFLISANLREEQIYFKPIGKFIENRLRNLKHIFTQTEACATMLQNRRFINVSHAGDTRIDRVLAIADAPKDFAWLKKCFSDTPILVAGSTWPADEERLIPAIIKHGIQCIIAPHEVNEERLKDLEIQLPGAKRLSSLKEHPEQVAHVIVDTIGDLAHVYASGDLAYVGGGFGSGIHNILEPAAHGIPVIFGPRYEKFVEAAALIHGHAARSIENTEQALTAIQYFLLAENREQARITIGEYMRMQRGATERIYANLAACLHPTKTGQAFVK